MKGLESLRNYQVKTVLLSGIYTMTPLPPKCKYVLIPSEVLREKKAEVTKVCHFLSPPPHCHSSIQQIFIGHLLCVTQG